MTTGVSDRLTRTERAVVVAAEAYRRREGRAATWTEVASLTGHDRSKVVFVVFGLRRKGVIAFADNEPRSLEVRPEGLRQALEESRR